MKFNQSWCNQKSGKKVEQMALFIVDYETKS